jgi:hypothetical protein
LLSRDGADDQTTNGLAEPLLLTPVPEAPLPESLLLEPLPPDAPAVPVSPLPLPLPLPPELPSSESLWLREPLPPPESPPPLEPPPGSLPPDTGRAAGSK